MVSNPGNVLVHSGVNCRLSVSAVETSERYDSRQKPRVFRPVEKSRKKYLFELLLIVITENGISQIMHIVSFRWYYCSMEIKEIV
jgi:hypothetical protein